MDCLRTKKWQLVKLNLERIQQGEIVKPKCSMLWSLWIVQVLIAQSRPTLCNPIDYNPPGSSVHGNLQARILEWRAVPFSRESSRPSDQTQTSCLLVDSLPLSTREALKSANTQRNVFLNICSQTLYGRKEKKCFKFTES